MALGAGTLEGLVMQPAFWCGKRVLITGHTGFKGSWLSLWLQQSGADVSGFALEPPTHPNLYELASVESGMHSTHGDVRDLDALCRAIESNGPEIVFHLAAQSLVRESYAEPVATFATNVMGTVNVLEAVRRNACVRVVVLVTSDKCYENREWLWGYRENEPMGGHDPYSASKGCAELAAAAYRASFFISSSGGPHGPAVATARAGNVIGGGDWARDRLIPDIVRAFAASQPVRIRNPDAVRPWQHVLESLSGYLLLAELMWSRGHTFAGAWNFGPQAGDTRPVRWIVEVIAREWGADARWEIDRGMQPAEAITLRLDSSKATAELGWMPRWSLPTALRSIVEWHKAHLCGADLRAMTLRQIDAYTAALA